MALKIAESPLMAKKEKEKAPEAEDGAEKPDAEGAAPKGLLGKLLNKKMLMIAVPALVVVLAGAGAGTYFFVIKPHAAEKNKVAKAEAIAFPWRAPATSRVQRRARYPGQYPEQ